MLWYHLSHSSLLHWNHVTSSQLRMTSTFKTRFIFLFINMLSSLQLHHPLQFLSLSTCESVSLVSVSSFLHVDLNLHGEVWAGSFLEDSPVHLLFLGGRNFLIILSFAASSLFFVAPSFSLAASCLFFSLCFLCSFFCRSSSFSVSSCNTSH